MSYILCLYYISTVHHMQTTWTGHYVYFIFFCNTTVLICVNIFLKLLLTCLDDHELYITLILYLHSTPNYYLDWKPCLPCRSTIPVSGYTTPFLHAGMLAYCSPRLSIKATLALPIYPLLRCSHDHHYL